MNASPGVPPPAPRRATGSRREFLIAGGLLVAAGAGGGAALGLTADKPVHPPLTPHVSAEVLAAEQAEHTLVAGVDAALREATGRTRATLRLVRENHLAHARALRALIVEQAYPARAPAARPIGVVPAGRVAARERRASAIAAERALRLSGSSAVLLASISACEATHVELLS